MHLPIVVATVGPKLRALRFEVENADPATRPLPELSVGVAPFVAIWRALVDSDWDLRVKRRGHRFGRRRSQSLPRAVPPRSNSTRELFQVRYFDVGFWSQRTQHRTGTPHEYGGQSRCFRTRQIPMVRGDE